jgi:Mn2+/Fe2+ NRAMP family transporter
VNKRFHEAPAFYWLYTGLIVVGALIVVVLDESKQVPIILISQVANGILLPCVLVFMLRLSNRHDLMGEYRNSRPFNAIAWVAAIVMIILTLLLLISSFFPGRLPFPTT